MNVSQGWEIRGRGAEGERARLRRVGEREPARAARPGARRSLPARCEGGAVPQGRGGRAQSRLAIRLFLACG